MYNNESSVHLRLLLPLWCVSFANVVLLSFSLDIPCCSFRSPTHHSPSLPLHHPLSLSIECKESDSVASTGKFPSCVNSPHLLLLVFGYYVPSGIRYHRHHSLVTTSRMTLKVALLKDGIPRQESENHKEELFG